MSEKAGDDDKESLNGGDLGLGRGLKPGGIPYCSDLTEKSWQAGDEMKTHPLPAVTTPSYLACYPHHKGSSVTQGVNQVCDRCHHTPTHVVKCKSCRLDCSNGTGRKQFLEKISKPMRKFLHSSNSGSGNGVLSDNNCYDLSSTQASDYLDGDDHYPIFADIALGTSIRQQKRLFEQNRNEILQEKVAADASPVSGQENTGDIQGTSHRKGESELMQKLILAEREIEVLRHDLENCQEISEARCKAVRLFKGQSYAVQTQHLDSAKKANHLNKTLQDEINRIQFELEYQEATMSSSQEMWTARFNRVTAENTTLMSSNDELSEKVRKLQGEKLALARERDELMALLDVQERQRYESTRSQSSEDMKYGSFTSTELAVLGACRCRINSPQPCGCAHATALAKREISRLRSELSSCNRRGDESVILADSYRIAFEEQLNRNRALTRRLVEMTSLSIPNKTVGKPRAALRWLIKQLNEEDYLPPRVPPEFIPGKTEETNIKEDQDIQETNLSPEAKSQPPPNLAVDSQSDGPESTGSVNVDEGTSNVGDAPQPQEEETICHLTDRFSVMDMEKNPEKSDNEDQYAELVDCLENKNDEDIIDMLLEMISERTEALAHQRLAARMLAKKLTEAENKLVALTEEVFDK